MIDNVSVYKARLRMGEKLAEKILRVLARPRHRRRDPDSRHRAHRGACRSRSCSACKYREGFVKNRYIGRTFIMPGQEQRAKSVRRKLNAIELEFRGKNVLLVDDSIVRGTTSQQIIEMAREAGATQGLLRFRRAAGALPERLRHRHAGGGRAGRRRPHRRGSARKLIGADWLIYQDLDDLVRACLHHDSHIQEFDDSCFSGRYVTGRRHAERISRACRKSAPTRRRRGASSCIAAR